MSLSLLERPSHFVNPVCCSSKPCHRAALFLGPKKRQISIQRLLVNSFNKMTWEVTKLSSDIPQKATGKKIKQSLTTTSVGIDNCVATTCLPCQSMGCNKSYEEDGWWKGLSINFSQPLKSYILGIFRPWFLKMFSGLWQWKLRSYWNVCLPVWLECQDGSQYLPGSPVQFGIFMLILSTKYMKMKETSSDCPER